MTVRGFFKGVFLVLLLSGCLLGLWYGVVHALFGRPLMRLVGVALGAASFRGFILAFDLMWGRPPVFSKRPWERPWEEARRPPNW